MAAETVKKVLKPTPPVVMAPAPDRITLPIGMVEPNEVIRDAQVRELNGYDEEALVRTKTIGAAMVVALERATVSIGKEKATPAMLKDLFMADRQALLVAISRCTWGDKINVQHLVEGELLDGVYDLNDLPIREGDPADSWFDLQLPSGKVARAHWALGDVHEAILTSKGENSATFATFMINKCVEEIDGEMFLGGALKLSVLDRKFLVDQILERGNYGPQFDKTTISLGGEEITPAIQLGDLFPV